MRKTQVSRTLVILSALLLAAVPLFGQWHSDFRVTNTTGSSYTPYSGGWGIATDADDVYITWYDYTTSQRVRLHDFPIGSPSLTTSGEAVSTSYGYTPVIALSDGETFVTWYYSSGSYYLKTRERNGSWGPIINHGTRYAYGASILTDGGGNLHCGYHDTYSTDQVWYQRKNTGSNSYTSAVQVFSAGRYYCYYPSMCQTSDGNLHISFVHGSYSSGPRQVVHAWSTNNGASWSTEYVPGTSPAYYGYATSICYDSDDNLYIAYTSRNTPRHVYVVSGTTSSWSSPDQVSSSTYNYVYYPSICCDTSDNVWVCWDDRSGSTYEIFYNRMDGETGNWDGPAPLTNDDGQYSRRGQLTADADGNVHICWYDRRDGNYEIYYNWFGGGGSGPGGRDLACTRILDPVGPIATEPIVPEAVIVNFGGDPDSGYAICEITGPGANYDKGNLEGPIHLEPGQEDNVTFPPWTPPGGPGDEYRVTVTVYLWPEETIEDDDPSNNTQVEYCHIEGGLQVDAVVVTAPEEGLAYDHLAPAATFENTGTELATDFYCYCEIYSMGFMTEPYIDSFPVASLDVEETVDVPFADWYCDDELMYDAMFYAAIPGETERELLGEYITVSFQGTEWTGIDELPMGAVIALAGESPVRDDALINYALPSPTDVNVSVYDVSGALVSTLHDGQLSGEGSLRWDASAAGTGIYFVRIATPDFSHTIKLIMVH